MPTPDAEPTASLVVNCVAVCPGVRRPVTPPVVVAPPMAEAPPGVVAPPGELAPPGLVAPPPVRPSDVPAAVRAPSVNEVAGGESVSDPFTLRERALVPVADELSAPVPSPLAPTAEVVAGIELCELVALLVVASEDETRA